MVTAYLRQSISQIVPVATTVIFGVRIPRQEIKSEERETSSTLKNI
jgi:hypothetical protein